MLKSLTSLFSFGASAPAGIASSIHSLISNSIFPLVTYAQEPLPQRTAPRRVQDRVSLSVPKATGASMQQLTPRIGLCLRPVTSLSPAGILRGLALRILSRPLTHDADHRVAVCSTVLAVHSDGPQVHDAAIGESLHDDDTTLRHKAEEADLAVPINLGPPLLHSLWQISNVEPLMMECLGSDSTFSEITREDTQNSRPWAHPTSRDEDPENMRHQIPAHDVHFEHEDQICDAQTGNDLCEEPTAAPSTKVTASEDASGKRVASFQSSSDASTRRSSIWDDDYGREAGDDDASDVTDISDPDEGNHRNVEKPSSTSLDTDDSCSYLEYSDPKLNTPNLQQSNITLVGSPKRRRSSHPALLLSQAENSHLHADQTRLQEENAHLQSSKTQLLFENKDLVSRNTSLHASLATTTKSLAVAQDTITTQDLQLHSLRRRVSFLERWVDSLHEEKVALHEDNVALREIGNARAQAVDELRESYERLEEVVEKAVGASKKPHDCLLEVELEGVRGRLGGLRIVS